MKKYFLLIVVSIPMIVVAQPGDKMNKDHDILLANDSILYQLRRMEDSAKKAGDSILFQKQMQQNTDSILQLQKSRNARAKKAAIIRIGTGLALLIVLIIGLMRKRKKSERV